MNARKKAPRAAPKGRKIVATVKASEQFGAWLDRFARHRRVSRAALLEHSLVFYARSQRFEEPPER